MARAWTAFALLAACGEAAPPVGRLDGGPPRDGGIPDGEIARPDAGGRGPAPVLPPADLEIALPYMGPVERVERMVDSRPGRLDVHFSIDTTGSFGGEIDALQSDLSVRIIPALEARVGDVAFGVSRFEDFPIAPFGAQGDRPFELLTPITTSRAQVTSAVARLDQPLGNGGDVPESGFEALYQIATGAGLASAGRQWIAPYVGEGEGGVGFRAGAIRAVVHVTDAPSHHPEDYGALVPGTRGIRDAGRALREVGAQLLGIASHTNARPQLEVLARDTGAVVAAEPRGCPMGVGGAFLPAVGGRCPLVFDIGSDGSGLSAAIVDALAGLLDTVVWSEVFGRTDDRLGFVRAVEAVSASVPAGEPPVAVDVRPVDGVADTFVDVRPGAQLRFALLLRNTTVPPADYDQVFRVRLEIVGDDVVLDSFVVRVVVPFGRLDGGVRNAGVDAGEDAGDAGDAEDAGEVDAGEADAGEADAGE